MEIQGTPQRNLEQDPGFDWTEYELGYWRLKGMQVGGDKNLQYLQCLHSPKEFPGEVVVDIGCGPFGGVLPYVKAQKRIAVEPLYEKYREENLWKAEAGIEVRACFAEEMDLASDSVNVVFACNSLDHGESILDALREVARILIPGGRFFLHVHCRTKQQLNKGHRQAFGPADLLLMARQAGLEPVRWDVYERDPVEGKYKAFIGDFRKAVHPPQPMGWWERVSLRIRCRLRGSIR